ncbi:MAG: hypothetical protein ACPGGK_04315 [Pikeienuella sp.]
MKKPVSFTGMATGFVFYEVQKHTFQVEITTPKALYAGGLELRFPQHGFTFRGASPLLRG